MKASRRSAICALQILIPLCSVVCATAHAADLATVAAAPRAPRAPLDLRVPRLRQVMTHSELLADMGSSSGDEESIEVVAAPVLVAMSFDWQTPWGLSTLCAGQLITRHKYGEYCYRRTSRLKSAE